MRITNNSCNTSFDCRECYNQFTCDVLNLHTCGNRGNLQRTVENGKNIWYVGCLNADCSTAHGYGPFNTMIDAMVHWNKLYNIGNNYGNS